MDFELVSIEEEERLRQRILAEAHKLLNVKFAHRGVTRWGVDCKGFIYLSYKKAGVDVPMGDGKIYMPDWYLFVKPGDNRYLNTMLKYFRYIDNPKLGDLITFTCYEGVVTHGGIVDTKNRFIHAESGRRVDFTDIDHRFYKSRFYKYLRHRSFND